MVPVKNLDRAKQRLAPILNVRERHRLFRAMLEDVLSALAGVSGLAGVRIVTRDPEVGALAERFDARIMEEPENLGQTQAVSFAAQQLINQGIPSMLTVPADIPLVTVDELEALLMVHKRAPAITIAPARDELGSNAVLCSPPDALAFRFGDNSFFPHLESARQHGIEPSIVKRPGLGLDIDVADDLMVFAAKDSDTKTYQYLSTAGIVERLEVPALSAARCPKPG